MCTLAVILLLLHPFLWPASAPNRLTSWLIDESGTARSSVDRAQAYAGGRPGEAIGASEARKVQRWKNAGGRLVFSGRAAVAAQRQVENKSKFDCATKDRLVESCLNVLVSSILHNACQTMLLVVCARSYSVLVTPSYAGTLSMRDRIRDTDRSLAASLAARTTSCQVSSP
jgi:hypothetical protein